MSDFSKQYTVEEEIKKIQETRYEILECLVCVINQSCQIKIENDKFYIDHQCISAYEDAFCLLEKFGILKKSLGRKYWIDWEALERQKPLPERTT